MKSFFSFLKTTRFPTTKSIVSLAFEERGIYRTLFWVVVLTGGTILFFILLSLSRSLSTLVPDYGGTLHHGVVGAPQKSTPFEATNETDTLLSTLLFSGLIEKNTDGTFTPIIAELCTSSESKQTLECLLRETMFFNKKTPLTLEDVIFSYTVHAKERSLPIQITQKNSRTILFETTTPEVDLISFATKGVVSKTQWQEYTEGTRQVLDGVGPYRIDRIRYKSLTPKVLILKRNPYFPIKKSFIQNIEIEIFPNEERLIRAVEEGDSDSALVRPSSERIFSEKISTHLVPTGTLVTLFTSSSAGELRTLLSTLDPLIDKKSIIDTIENGYGIPLEDTATTIEAVQKKLSSLGYTKNSLGTLTKQGAPVMISIAFQNDPSLARIADEVARMLGELGLLVDLKGFDQGTYTDEREKGSFSLLLEKRSAPLAGYVPASTLYNTAVVHITMKHLVLPDSLLYSGIQEYIQTVPQWALRTDSIWKK